MPKAKNKMRVAMAAWEIGRVSSGLGAKIGGLGVIVEELPPELVKAAARQNIDLEVEILSPCFGHYDKSQLTKLNLRLPVTLNGSTFEFEVYRHIFPDGQKVIYFWDDWQLNWTTANAIYPDNPQMGLTLYAAIGQAMAGYIKQGQFDTVHLHDYHVGHCAYLYHWLDISDRAGEANAFFGQIKAAIDTYRHNPVRHRELVYLAMEIDASWDKSAGQYVNMYRYGLLVKKWQAERRKLIDKFIKLLNDDRHVFAEFFIPGQKEYADQYDWRLKEALEKVKD